MNYQALTKDRLIGIIKDYQLLTCQLIAEVDRDTGCDISPGGNLGHWYLNLRTDCMTGNPMKFRALGYTDYEILQSVPTRNFLSRIHPDDALMIVDKLTALRNGDTSEYKAEYRVCVGENTYKRFHDRGRITQYDDSGRPLLLTGSTNEIKSLDESTDKKSYRGIDPYEQTFLDNLTRAKNRRALLRDLSAAVTLSEHNSSPFILTLLRIDDFKEVNEARGHLCGNKILIDIAQLIRQNVGENGTFGRYCAEKFMIIFSQTDQEEAIRVLERIRTSIERFGFPDDIKVTISGVMKEYEGEDLSELIGNVETKLLQIKNGGKNRIAC